MGRRINDMLNCNEFRKGGGTIFNKVKKIPQNHFSCMPEIERKSADEPGMMMELLR